MAIYESNQRYKCRKCGYDMFEEKTVFLIEEIVDKTKITYVTNKKKISSTKKVICLSCSTAVIGTVE